jgi:hypothetical protein
MLLIDQFQQLCLRRTRLRVNQFSRNLCEMESPGKDKENETNRDLLQSTVQKLPILRRKKTQNCKKVGHGQFL